MLRRLQLKQRHKETLSLDSIDLLQETQNQQRHSCRSGERGIDKGNDMQRLITASAGSPVDPAFGDAER